MGIEESAWRLVTIYQLPQYYKYIVLINAVLDIFGDHLLYCEKGSNMIRRHDAQVLLLAKDLAKAAGHPVFDGPDPSPMQ